MEKRLLLAIVLSLLILLSWSAFVTKTYHIANKEVAISTPAVISTESRPIADQPFEDKQTALPLLQYENEKCGFTFIEPQAAIKEVIFKNYNNYKFNLKNGFSLSDKSLSFVKESSSPTAVTFVHLGPNKKITKKFVFRNSDYTIELEIKIRNLSSVPTKASIPLVLGSLDFSPRDIQARYQDVFVATEDKTKHYNAKQNVQFEEVKFLGLRDRYCCAIIEPASVHYTGFIHKLNSQGSEINLNSPELTLEAGQEFEQKFRIYLGPQELRLINAIKPQWSAVINYGTFDFIAKILVQLLEFLYNVVHNWGLAIVILSFAVYIFLYPLTLKQMRSMKEMQLLQPHIEELRKIYKDNPQKLNKEILELYRQHKVNPLGGCLPLLLQMPIFFALYQALSRSVVLRGASFLWIKDLSEPDRLFLLPASLPVLGNEINVLPILMTIGMFIQQKISTVATTSTSAEQQRLMQIIMPLMFGLIFYHMPAGLVLYWFINSTLMLLYQLKISRIK